MTFVNAKPEGLSLEDALMKFGPTDLQQAYRQAVENWIAAGSPRKGPVISIQRSWHRGGTTRTSTGDKSYGNMLRAEDRLRHAFLGMLINGTLIAYASKNNPANSPEQIRQQAWVHYEPIWEENTARWSDGTVYYDISVSLQVADSNPRRMTKESIVREVCIEFASCGKFDRTREKDHGYQQEVLKILYPIACAKMVAAGLSSSSSKSFKTMVAGRKNGGASNWEDMIGVANRRPAEADKLGK